MNGTSTLVVEQVVLVRSTDNLGREDEPVSLLSWMKRCRQCVSESGAIGPSLGNVLASQPLGRRCNQPLPMTAMTN